MSVTVTQHGYAANVHSIKILCVNVGKGMDGYNYFITAVPFLFYFYSKHTGILGTRQI